MRDLPTPNGIRRAASLAELDAALEAINADPERWTPTQRESLIAAAIETAERLTAKADAEEVN